MKTVHTIIATLLLCLFFCCGFDAANNCTKNTITVASNEINVKKTDEVNMSGKKMTRVSGDVASTNKVKNFNLETKRVTLNNGFEMPILGIGTYNLKPAQAEESVYNALLCGYKLIDTANAYMNERAVGRGIKRSGVPRDEIFVTTKLWVSEYGDAERAIDDTLTRLDLEYIDLLLLHQPYGDYLEAYKAMEKAVKAGKVRSIGLSNFYEKKFNEIMNIANIPPAVLQNESNPFFHQVAMRDYLRQYGTILMAWFPLGGRGNTQALFENEAIMKVAKAHNKTPAQVVLRWHMQTGNIAIPGSSNPTHIMENIKIFDFKLTDGEMQKIKALDKNQGVYDYISPDLDEERGKGFKSFSPDFNAQE